MTLTATRRRRLAIGVTGALVGGLCAVAMPTAAQSTPSRAAELAAGPLTWNISEQFVDHLSTRTLTDGATFHEEGATFGFPATGITTEADGDVVRSFRGSVKGAFAMNGTEYYSVTLAQPTITVEPDGDGEVTAVVSAANIGRGPGAPGDSTDPTRVTVVEFSGARSTDRTFNALPSWETQSFHPEFLGAITPGVRPHFRATGSDSDAKKAAGRLYAAQPTIDAAVTESSYADGVSVRVRAAGFSPEVNPGDAGVYVGLAPADTEVDFGSREGTSDFAVVDWVAAARFTGDTFATVLTAPTGKLVEGKDYAVFTWQAHTHSNWVQDTRTPVTIDWSTLKPAPVKRASRVVTRLAKKPTRKRIGRLVVAVRGRAGVAAGRVVVQVRRGKKPVRTVRVRLNKRGKAVVRLPRGKRGVWRAVMSYRGSKVYKPSRKVVKYRIR